MALTLDNLRKQLPEGWAAGIPSGGRFGLGLDVASSDRVTSNPSALVVRQQVGTRATEWLVLSWKSRDPEAMLLICKTVVTDLAEFGHRPRGLWVDNSNEKLFPPRLRKHLAGLCNVRGVGGGDVLTWEGQTYRAKQLLGSLYVQEYEDGLITCPRADWIKADRRLLRRKGDSFDADVNGQGQHFDTGDAGKLAMGACRVGRGQIMAANAGKGGKEDRRAHALHPSVKPRARRLTL